MSPTPEDLLRRLPVLAGLDDRAVRFLATLVREEHHPAGAIIVAEGEPGNRVFFVCAGRVRVVKDRGARRPVTLVEMTAGDFFGEMSLVESVPRSASVVAAEDTTVFTLKGTDFYKLYRQLPDQYGIVVLNIARDLARRLRALDDRFAALSH